MLNFGAAKAWQNHLNAALFLAACALAGIAAFFFFYKIYQLPTVKLPPIPPITTQAEAVFKKLGRISQKNDRDNFARQVNLLINLWPEAMTIFGEKIRSGNEIEREAVLTVLEQVSDRRALPLLMENANAVSDPVLRARLLELSGRIGWFHDAFLQEKLVPFLKDSDSVVANAAAFSLLCIGSNEGRQTLIDNLKSDDESASLSALERLDVSRSCDAAKTLAELLPENPDSPAKLALARKSIEALTGFRYLPPRAKISSYLQNENFDLRHYANEYLFSVKPADCTNAAEKAFDFWRGHEKLKDDLAAQTLLVQMAGLVCALKRADAKENFPARKFLSDLVKVNPEKKTDKQKNYLEQTALFVMGKSGDRFFVPVMIGVIRESSDDNVLRTAHKSLQALTYANFLNPTQKAFAREEVIALWEDWWAKHREESRVAWLRLSVDRNLSLMVINQSKGVPARDIFSRVFEPHVRPLVFRTFAYSAGRSKDDYDYCLYRWEKWWKEKRPLTRPDWRNDELIFSMEMLNSPEPDLRCWAYGRLISEGLFPPVQSLIFWREAPDDLRAQAVDYWKKRYEMFRDNHDFAPVGEEY